MHVVGIKMVIRENPVAKLCHFLGGLQIGICLKMESPALIKDQTLQYNGIGYTYHNSWLYMCSIIG